MILNISLCLCSLWGAGVSSACSSMYGGPCGAICIICRFLSVEVCELGIWRLQPKIPSEPRSQYVTSGWDPIVSFRVESKSIFCYTRTYNFL